jgi:hypothetical protein
MPTLTHSFSQTDSAIKITCFTRCQKAFGGRESIASVVTRALCVGQRRDFAFQPNVPQILGSILPISDADLPPCIFAMMVRS